MRKLSGFYFLEDIYINSEYLLEQWDFGLGTTRPNDPFAIPVRLSSEAGLVRDWCSQLNEHQTMITLRPAKEWEAPQAVNGTIVNMIYTDNSMLSKKQNFTVQKLTTDLFTPLGWQSVPDVPFVNIAQHNAIAAADMRSPILQSYLDICLKGCLEYGEEFAIEFLESITGWSKFWVNDRSIPRRPWIHEKKHQLLDELLAKYPSQGNCFHERKLESEYSVYFVEEKLRKNEELNAIQKPQTLQKLGTINKTEAMQEVKTTQNPKTEGITTAPSTPRSNQKLKEQAVHFIFGFGSLINYASRRQTNPESKDVIPVRISPEFGYVRSWNFHGSSSKLTALGVRKVKKGEKESAINGIIYPVNGADMGLVDKREEGYTRVKVPWALVKGLSWAALPNPEQTQLWMYLPKFPQVPNAEYPILQTYVDVCLNGCLEYGEGFAREFLETTFDWNQFWLNDRLLARRPWVHCPNHLLIDRLLAEYPKKANMAHHRKLSVEYAVHFV